MNTLVVTCTVHFVHTSISTEECLQVGPVSSTINLENVNSTVYNGGIRICTRGPIPISFMTMILPHGAKGIALYIITLNKTVTPKISINFRFNSQYIINRLNIMSNYKQRGEWVS